MTEPGAAMLLLPSLVEHIESRIRALALEISELRAQCVADKEWLEFGKIVSAMLKEINAKVDENKAGIQEQTALLERVQWDIDQFRLDNAQPPENSTYARLHMHIVALRQRMMAIELQVAVAIEKLDQINASQQCSPLKQWWKRAPS